MTEAWVLCFGGAYAVSNLGRVRREKTNGSTRAGRLLSIARSSRGYCHVDLYDAGAHRIMSVHRLVAEAFLGPAPEGAQQVNHKNGDKSDNRVDNLEYVSCGDNHRHAYRIGLRDAPTRKLSADDVRAIRARLASGARQTHLAREFGVTQSTIWSIGNGRTWKEVAS